MTSPYDIVELPGQPGYYARRVIVEAWVAAGSPWVNSAGRLYADQKEAWDAYQGGYGSPADNPDDPSSYQLGHCRFVALDIDATPSRVAALRAAGLIRPFPYESWHWTVPNIYDYPIVHEIPSTASDGSTPFEPEESQEDDMYAIKNYGVADSGIIIRGSDAPYTLSDGDFNLVAGTFGLKVLHLAKWQYDGIIARQWEAFTVNKKMLEQGVDKDDADAIIAGVKASIPATPPKV